MLAWRFHAYRTQKSPRAQKVCPALANCQTAIAASFHGSLAAAGFPPSRAWQSAKPVIFDSDWQRKNPDPRCQTKSAFCGRANFLYLKFVSRYRSSPSSKMPTLTVAATSFGTAMSLKFSCNLTPLSFAATKNSKLVQRLWIDLEIANGALQHLKTDLQSRVNIKRAAKTWTAELAIPMKSLTPRFDPSSIWRLNFFRVEGPVEPRFYSSCSQPTPLNQTSTCPSVLDT